MFGHINYLQNLDAALQKIYKLLPTEFQVSYSAVYVTSWLFCLPFKIFTKVEGIVQINAQMFLVLYILANRVIKFSGGFDIFFILRKKTASCACLMGSRVKDIFHWLVQAFILLKSLFKLLADKFILLTTEKVKHCLQRAWHLQWGLLKEHLYRQKITVG